MAYLIVKMASADMFTAMEHPVAQMVFGGLIITMEQVVGRMVSADIIIITNLPNKMVNLACFVHRGAQQAACPLLQRKLLESRYEAHNSSTFFHLQHGCAG